jgi:hypothetical protein
VVVLESVAAGSQLLNTTGSNTSKIAVNRITKFFVYTPTLALPDPEHLSPAHGTYTLSCRLTVLHGYGPGIPHLPLGAALHAVCLHLITSFLI